MDFDTEVRVEASVDEVFAVLAAVERYHDWLPPSDTYVRTQLANDNPIEEGAVYVDHQKMGMEMRGEVHIYDPPSRIGFRQTKELPCGAQISTRIEYTLTADQDGARVARHQVYTVPWPMRPLQPILRRKIVHENRRILGALKAAAESASQEPSMKP